MTKTVGYSNRTRYWQVYAFSNSPEGYNYKRGLDLPAYRLGFKSQFLQHTKFFAPFQGIDLYHTYNSVVATSKPWVVEVESLLPRYGKLDINSSKYRWGVKKIRQNNCKQIIFTSHFSLKMNKASFEKNGIDPNKLKVVYRAIERYENTSANESTFNIIFAGNGFYRKGGLELLRAFNQFNHADARLTIISRLEIDWEIYPTAEEIEEVNKIIASDSRITVKTDIEHSQVVKEMQRSHAFVATTFSDPFNNTILEALACGIPVITSENRSIPEYVFNNENGFSRKIDNMQNDEIVAFILEKLETLYSDSALWTNYSSTALSKCKSLFDIEVRNSALKKVYDSAIRG